MAEVDYGKEIKKICFEDSDKRHADLKIRLHSDGIKQAEFFRLLITGYIEKDERVMNYIEEYKDNNQIQSKVKSLKSKTLRQKGEEIKNQFALTGDEIESIFNLLEEEKPEL